MAYIVQAKSGGPDGNAVSVTMVDRQEALSMALGWLDDGCSGGKIIGDGQISGRIQPGLRERKAA
jgi:hypothetical protein